MRGLVWFGGGLGCTEPAVVGLGRGALGSSRRRRRRRGRRRRRWASAFDLKKSHHWGNSQTSSCAEQPHTFHTSSCLQRIQRCVCVCVCVCRPSHLLSDHLSAPCSNQIYIPSYFCITHVARQWVSGSVGQSVISLGDVEEQHGSVQYE